MDIETNLLIKLVQERPILWDKSLEEYKYKKLTLKTWKEICGILNEDFGSFDETYKKEYTNTVIKKWKNIKDCWMKYIKETKSGSVTKKKTKKYIYSDQLEFLKKNIPIHNTTSTLRNSFTAHQTTTVASTSDAFVTPTPISTPTSAKNKKMDDPEKALIDLLSQREDRHLSFFRGILPSLQNFDEAKTRKFQIAVLQIIDNLDNNLPAFPSHQ